LKPTFVWKRVAGDASRIVSMRLVGNGDLTNLVLQELS
jgi:hypothetical protein